MGKVKARQLVLRYQGLFDFDGLYQHIVTFFKRRQYDYIEGLWKEKDASPIGREITVKMAPEKNVTEYILNKYKVEWKCIDTHKVEVVRDGKTVSLTHARFHFKVSGTVEYDWQGYAKEANRIGKLFNEKIAQREINKLWVSRLEEEIQELLDSMKAFLHMESSRTNKEAVHG